MLKSWTCNNSHSLLHGSGEWPCFSLEPNEGFTCMSSRLAICQVRSSLSTGNHKLGGHNEVVTIWKSLLFVSKVVGVHPVPSKLHLPPRSRPSNINGPSGRIRTRDFLKFCWKAALSPFRGLFNVIGYGNVGQVTIGILCCICRKYSEDFQPTLCFLECNT